MKKSFLLFIVLCFFVFNINCNAKTINQNYIVEHHFERTEDAYPQFPVLNNGDNFTCENIFYSKDGSGAVSEKQFKKLLDNIFTIMKILGPVLAIVTATIDYIKTVLNVDSMNKANTRTFKRIGLAISVAFLPFLLDFILEMYGLYDISRCGIGG